MRNSNGTFMKGHKLFVKPDIYRKCPNCNKTFKLDKKNPATKYCCHQCSVVHLLKGKPKSREHIEKMKKNSAKYWLGKKQTSKHILKAISGLKIYQSGEKHWNWKGGITPILKTWRYKSWYKQWRDSIFERDNYTCQICGIRGGRLQAHHFINFSTLVKNKDLGMLKNIDNGISYCISCHQNKDEYAKRFREKSV